MLLKMNNTRLVCTEMADEWLSLSSWFILLRMCGVQMFSMVCVCVCVRYSGFYITFFPRVPPSGAGPVSKLVQSVASRFDQLLP